MECDWQRDEPWQSSCSTAGGHISHRKSDEDFSEDLPVVVQQEIEDLCYYVPEVTDHFSVLDKIGEGSFSSVFLAGLKHHKDVKERFALKHVIPTSHPNRVVAELKCLQLFGGRENVMGVELCLKNRDHVVIIMRYFPHHKFQDYFNTFDVSDVQDYMKNLLIALRHIHRSDIIHRDVKPNNFLHNTETKKYALVDFGLAQDAPVKLYEGNKGRPALITLPKKRKHKKENDRYGSTGSPSDYSSPEKRDGVARMPLSPINRSKVSTRKPGSQAVSNLRIPLSPEKSRQTKEHLSSKQPALATAQTRGRSRQRQKPYRGPSAENTAAAALTGSVTPSPHQALLQSMMKNQMSKTKKVERSKSLGLTTLYKTHRKQQGHSQPEKCGCYGRPVICSVCTSRPVETAQRAGTPGFRAPEVLMKHPQQTTAVDIWSAGVILLSLLSGRYPFFRGNDDMMCLSQILSLLGTSKVQKAALTFDKLVTSQPETRPLDVKSLCQRLRSSTDNADDKRNPTKQWPEIPDNAVHLLSRLLDPNPVTRITAEEALSHPFFSEQ